MILIGRCLHLAATIESREATVLSLSCVLTTLSVLCGRAFDSL